ncbi:MAG: hypothetical protein LC637_11490 [Xanthomonadaceae bacterium]|nr:hypothetical protein [Xanthomonadaceae bacterium]
MNKTPSYSPSRAPVALRSNRGAALFISLMFLIILTLIGLSAANVGVLQERMAGSVRETNEAFQRAESTLREIEAQLATTVAGAGGVLGTIRIWPEAKAAFNLEHRDCLLAGAPVDDWPWVPAPATDESNFVVIALTKDLLPTGEPIAEPCALVEDEGGITGSVSPTPLDSYYLIATRATGSVGVGDVILQSIYFVPGG